MSLLEILKTGLIWGSMPYVFVIVAAFTYAWRNAIGVGLLGLIGLVIAYFVAAIIIGWREGKAWKLKGEQHMADLAERQATVAALEALRPDPGADVSPRPRRRRKLPTTAKALTGPIGHHWRA